MTKNDATGRPLRGVPRGKEEVTDAILRAATELFASQPWSAVSLRAIAAKAGVNYGLVHRHFGSRDEVVKAVFAQAAANNTSALEGDDLAEALSYLFLRGTNGIGKVIASAMLAGVDPHSLHDSFPGTRRLAQLATEAMPEGLQWDERHIDSRVFGAVMLAAAFGWRFFEPFLVASVGIEDIPPEERNAEVLASLRMLLARVTEP